MGNYINGTGGTGKVITEHQKLMNENSISYIHISTYVKYVLGHKIVNDFYNLIEDGNDCGLQTKSELLNYLVENSKNGAQLDCLFIHHLLRFDWDFVNDICNLSHCNIVFYVHDYYSICRNHTLMKNGINYCGENSPCLSKCKDCKYYLGIEEHLDHFREFFKQFQHRIIPIAPSACPLNIWLTTYPQFSTQGKIVSHQNVDKLILHKPVSHERLRIGFVGAQIKYKGWNEWKTMVETCIKQNLPYDFYYFGNYDEHMSGVTYVPVTVNARHPNAMIEALNEHEIDCSFLFSLWPETYSYTYFESWSAGALILTQANSGNIADMVRLHNNGYVAENVEELLALMQNVLDFREIVIRLQANYMIPEKLQPNKNGVLQLLSNENYKIDINDFVLINKNIREKMINLLYCKKHGI